MNTGINTGINTHFPAPIPPEFSEAVARIEAIGTGHMARFYYGLVLMLRPRVVLETGLYHGHTTAWLALACKEVGAHLVAVDNFSWNNSPELLAGNLAACGVAEAVTLVKGDAVPTLARLGGEGFFDGLGLAILDDVHTCEQVVAEADVLWPYLEEGGVLGSHDAQFSDFPGVRQAFLLLEARYGRSPMWFRHSAGYAMLQKWAPGRVPRLFTAQEHAQHERGVGQG